MTTATSLAHFTPAEVARARELVTNAMCGDFCLEDDCPACWEARLKALQQVVRDRLKARLKITAALVRDGVRHKDALDTLKAYIGELAE